MNLFKVLLVLLVLLGWLIPWQTLSWWRPRIIATLVVAIITTFALLLGGDPYSLVTKSNLEDAYNHG